jgi:hypothetical protein
MQFPKLIYQFYFLFFENSLPENELLGLKHVKNIQKIKN